MDKKKPTKPGKRKRQDDVDDIRSAVEKRVAVENETLGPETECFIGDGLTLTDLNGYRKRKESGTGEIMGIMHRDKFRYIADLDRWVKFEEGVAWGYDETQDFWQMAEAVAVRLCDLLYSVEEQLLAARKADDREKIKSLEVKRSNIIKVVDRLRTQAGRKNAIAFAKSNTVCSLAVLSRNFDRDVYQFPVGKGQSNGNGVLSTHTGELTPGRPGLMMLRGTDTPYYGIDAESPLWSKKVLEICDDDPEMVAFVQRQLGQALIRRRTTDKLFIWSGRGRNGKGLIMETVASVLGELASPLPVDLLIEQSKGRSAGAATPELELLRGLQIGWASEVDDKRRFSVAAIKRLTGGDQIVTRGLFSDFTKLTPSHSIFLLTNEIPSAPFQDYAFWSRICLTEFPLSFVDWEPVEAFERKADPDLPEKLKSEYPGILAWLVIGCLEFQRIGLCPPEKAISRVRAERQSNDPLFEYIESRCIEKPELKCGATQLYNDFFEWWSKEISDKKIPSQKTFGGWLTHRKYDKKRTGPNSIFEYHGIGLKSEYDLLNDERL